MTNHWNDECRLSNDELRHSVYFIFYVKSPKPAPIVIPAKAGIHLLKMDLDSGLRRSDGMGNSHDLVIYKT